MQDVVKTRVQTWDLVSTSRSASIGRDAQPLLTPQPSAVSRATLLERPSTYRIARDAYHNEGAAVFFRGLGICSARAFVVNAVQWTVSAVFFDKLTRILNTQQIYEWMMDLLAR